MQSGVDFAEWIDHFHKLADAIDNPDFAYARLRARLGLLADHDDGMLECGVADLAFARSQSWMKVTRLARAINESRPVLIDVLSGLAKSRIPVSILISGGIGLHLGLPKTAIGARDWVRSVMAPGSLLDIIDMPDLSRFRGDVNGLRLTLVAGGGNGTDPNAPAAAIPGLARLLLAPEDRWSILLRLDPMSVRTGLQLRGTMAECATRLGEIGSSTMHNDVGPAITTTRPDVERLLEQITAQLAHLEIGEGAGIWQTSIHIAGADEATVDLMTSVMSSLFVDEPISGGHWIGDRLVEVTSPERPAPASLLSTADFSALLTAPEDSAPGLRVTAAPPAGRSSVANRKSLMLGYWRGVNDPFGIGLEDLEGHGFITGTTGSGKSTTAQRLLAELWNRHDVPFLVIDPVKADYESVAPMLRGDLLVVDAAELRMNVLAPYPGFSATTHVELVSNAFKGSFSLPSPVPYIVSQLFELLADRVEADPPITLHELRDILDPFVIGLGYDSEITSNIRASLGTRLGLLLSPSKGERVAAPANTMIDSFFRGPTVVALSGLGDDEERAFLTTILTLFVYERARVRGPSPDVLHVTVLEEAHRIVPEPQQNSDPEAGDATSVSAKLLTQMLAEIRSYGEAFLVIDQSPSSVARDVVKNTNLKIAHRMLDPDDQQVVAGSMGIGEAQRESLGLLDRGEAIVSTRRLPGPQTVEVEPAGLRSDSNRTRSPARANRAEDPRDCCSGSDTPLHHAAERSSLGAESAMSLALAGLIAGGSGRAQLWDEVNLQLNSVIAKDAVLSRDRDAARDCVAWVGLRRALSQYVAFGMIVPHEIRIYLRAGVYAWRKQCPQRAFTRLRVLTEARTGPYYGCRFCDTACHFRNFAAASEPFGIHNAMTSVQNPWDRSYASGKEALIAWAKDLTPTLRQYFGDRKEARGAALCVLTQYLDGRGAPALVHEDLLSRVPRDV